MQEATEWSVPAPVAAGVEQQEPATGARRVRAPQVRPAVKAEWEEQEARAVVAWEERSTAKAPAR